MSPHLGRARARRGSEYRRGGWHPARCVHRPAEKAGKAVDNAGQELKDAADDVGNAIEDACEDVKEGVDAEDTDC
jgi:hypothetical protein